MDTDSTPRGGGANAASVPDEGAPPLPDDPRVPTVDDADPSTSKELGGAAPAVGPKPSKQRPARPDPQSPSGRADEGDDPSAGIEAHHEGPV